MTCQYAMLYVSMGELLVELISVFVCVHVCGQIRRLVYRMVHCAPQICRSDCAMNLV